MKFIITSLLVLFVACMECAKPITIKELGFSYQDTTSRPNRHLYVTCHYQKLADECVASLGRVEAPKGTADKFHRPKATSYASKGVVVLYSGTCSDGIKAFREVPGCAMEQCKIGTCLK